MAYAGSIVIKANLDTKDINKEMTSLNNALSKLKLEIFAKLKKDIRGASSGIKSLTKNIKEFQEIKINSAKFEKMAELLARMRTSALGLTQTFKNFAIATQMINVAAVQDVTKTFQRLSKIDFSKLVQFLNTGIIEETEKVEKAASKFEQFKERVAKFKEKTSIILKTLFSVVRSVFNGIVTVVKKASSKLKNLTNTVAKIVSNMKNKVTSNLKKMGSTFKSVMYALGVDLSVVGLVRGLKTAVTEMQSLQSATLSLSSMLTANNMSVTKANEFIKKFAEDGMVSLQSAMIQYKNLSLRGFQAEQIEKLMTIAKDFAVVNRKSGVTLESALENLTEGIKLDMSRLMDASGLSKNLSAIYSDYADKINKYVSDLSDNEKNLAIIDYFEEMDKYSRGNAAKMADTFVGTVSKMKVQLKYLFTEIGNTVGFVLKPILEDITEIFTKWKLAVEAVNMKINELVKSINEGENKLFGIFKSVLDTLRGTETELEGIQNITDGGAAFDSEGVDNMTESVEELGEATEKVLAPFDTLNQVKFKTGDDEGEGQDMKLLEGQEKDEEVIKERVYWLDYLKKAVNNFIEELKLNKTKLKSAWEDFLSVFGIKSDKSLEENNLNSMDLKSIGKALKDGIKEGIKFTVEDFLPTTLKTVADVVSIILGSFDEGTFNNLSVSLNNFWSTVWGDNGEEFNKKITNFTKNILVPFLKWLVVSILPRLIDLITELIDFIDREGPFIAEIFGKIWDKLEPLIDAISTLIIMFLHFISNMSSDGKTKLADFIANITILIGLLISLLPIITGLGKAFIKLFSLFGVGWALLAIVALISGFIHAYVYDFAIQMWGIVFKLFGKVKEKLDAFWDMFADDSKSTLENIFKIGKDLLSSSIEYLKEKFLEIWERNEEAGIGTIKNIIETTKELFSDLADIFVDFFSDTWRNIVDGFKIVLSDMWDAIKDGSFFYGNFDIEATMQKVANKNASNKTSLNRTSYTPKYATGASLPTSQIIKTSSVSDNWMMSDAQIMSMLDAINRNQQQSNNGGTVIQNVLKVDGQVLYTSNNKVSRQRGNLMISNR